MNHRRTRSFAPPVWISHQNEAGPGQALWALADQPEIRHILFDHAARGIRVQLLLRVMLVVFVLLTLLLQPPTYDVPLSWLITSLYAVAAAVSGVVLLTRDAFAARYGWAALFIDVIALASLTVVANGSPDSWASDILVNGLFIIPVLTATQLRPGVCVAVTVPTLVIFVAVEIAARHANADEPLRSVLLRSCALAVMTTGSFLLSRVQRSRVVTIGRMALEQQALLAETLSIEQREREDLAESLHDGALQYLLAARQDLADARSSGDSGPFDRLAVALSESSQLLRSTMTELHPAVLAQAGLRQVVDDVAQQFAKQSGVQTTVDGSGWPSTLRTQADPLLLSTARELLNNVRKHAQAQTVLVQLSWAADTARLVVQDDGRGMSEDILARRLARGHIGLHSRQTRVRAAGGDFEIGPASGGGTLVRVCVPAPQSPPDP